MPRKEYTRQIKKGREHFYCSLSCSLSHRNKTNPPTKGMKINHPGRVDEFTPFRYYVRKAKTRGKSHDLDLAYIKQLWESQNGRCAFTGIQLTPYDHRRGIQDNITLASLDRIDSSVGYVKGNVQFISAALNLAKQDMPDSQFRQGLATLFEAYQNLQPTVSKSLP
jgi:hypothetical protein